MLLHVQNIDFLSTFSSRLGSFIKNSTGNITPHYWEKERGYNSPSLLLCYRHWELWLNRLMTRVSFVVPYSHTVACSKQFTDTFLGFLTFLILTSLCKGTLLWLVLSKIQN